MLGTLVGVWLAAAGTPVRVAEAPFEGHGLSSEQMRFYEKHVRAALRRYGLPVDTVDESQQRAGSEAVDRCGADAEACSALRGAYPGVVRGKIVLGAQGSSAHLTVVDTATGANLASEDVSAPDTHALLDGLIEASGRLASRSAQSLGIEFQPDAPLRGYAVYPLVAGGVLIGTGAYFLVKAANDSSTLKGTGGSLNDAVNARNSGSTDLTLGLVLTGVGVASTVVGVIFYAPGAERKPLVSLSVEPTRGMVVMRGALP